MNGEQQVEFGFAAPDLPPWPGAHRIPPPNSKRNSDAVTSDGRENATARSGPNSLDQQGELGFAAGGSEKGHTEWLAGRRMATQQLARRMGLPLGHQVEVWLNGGIRLRGKLRLQEEVLFIEEEHVRHLGLMVDKLAFTYREMESCVRLD
jgi:hypothetical protein